MVKRISGIMMALGVAMVLAVAPARASQTDSEPALTSVGNSESPEINVTVSGSTLRVTGAAKLVLKVYYVTGTRAASYAIETDDQSISTGLNKGIYFVKVGKFVRKLTIS